MLVEGVSLFPWALGPRADHTLTEKDGGFRGLWRKVKPRDKPEEVRWLSTWRLFPHCYVQGMPFDTDDAMFNPPVSAGTPGVGMALSQYDAAGIPNVTYQDASPVGEAVRPLFLLGRLNRKFISSIAAAQAASRQGSGSPQDHPPRRRHAAFISGMQNWYG